MIKPRSVKRAKQEREYANESKIFLEDKECALAHLSFMPCYGPLTTHHKKGRIGILLLDKRYWLPVCLGHHQYLELNPLWAKEKGYSLSRLT